MPGNTALGLTTGLAFAEEPAFGTATTVTRAYEIQSEGIGRNPVRQDFSGLRAGTLHAHRGAQYVETARSAGGPFSMYVPTTGFGLLLKHAMGSNPAVAQQSGTPAYLQTHPFGSNAGMGLSCQKQLRDGGNTLVQRFTYKGGKILAVEFSIDQDGALMATFETDFVDEEITTAAAALTYANNTVFRFDQGTIAVGGTAIAKVNTASIRVERPQSTGKRYLGSAGLQAQPVENARPNITGSLDIEFDVDTKTAVYDRFVSNGAASLALIFTGGVISGAFNYQIRIEMPEIHFEGETPKAGGEGEVVLNAPFVSRWDGTNAEIVCYYQSTDTTY